MADGHDGCRDKFQVITGGRSSNLEYPKFPPSVSAHGMVANSSDIFVFGGVNIPQSFYHGLSQYNIATNEWREIESEGLPSSSLWSGISLQGKQLYIFGGSGSPDRDLLSNSLKRCSIDFDKLTKGKVTWDLLEANASVYNALDCGDNEPPIGDRQSILFHEDSLYVFSGYTGKWRPGVSIDSEIHKLSFSISTWEKVSPAGEIPTGCGSRVVAQDDDRFYVLCELQQNRGSYKSIGTCTCMSKIWSYHFQTNSWEVADLYGDPEHSSCFPRSREDYSITQVHNDVYITGGFSDNSCVMYYFDDVWKLNLTSKTWVKVSLSLPMGMVAHCSVISPSGYMYLCGGQQASNYVFVKYMYKARIPYILPRLSELCWEKLITIFQSVPEFDFSVINELGIPWTFLSRVPSAKR